MRDQIPESKTSQTVSDFIQKHFVGIKKNLAVMEPCMYTVTVSSITDNEMSIFVHDSILYINQKLLIIGCFIHAA